MNTEVLDVIIVGAGMTGLTAAQELAGAGLQIVVLDKGRSVGGRMATRRIGEGVADHGAQFFTVRSASFASFVEYCYAEGLVFEWSRGWSDGSLVDAPADGYPRYAVKGGMSQLPKDLSHGLPIRLSQRVMMITADREIWQVATESGEKYRARSLLLTPPVPQSLDLLGTGGMSLPDDILAVLQAVAYAPCLCGLFLIDGDTSLPEPGALQRPGNAISWIADNQRKGISPEARVVTVHAGPDASTAGWDNFDADVLEWLREGLQPFLTPDTVIVEQQLKRWRYALPTRLHPEPYLLAHADPLLVFAGDAFGSTRVEGSFLSGQAAAHVVIQTLVGR